MQMTNNEKARFNAFTLSLAHLMENTGITKEVPAIAEACETARQLLDAISDSNSRRAGKLGGATSKKQYYREELSRTALAIASIIRSYASDRNDLELKESMNYSYSELRYTGENRLNEHCSNILATARKLGPGLGAFGINEDMLKEFEHLMEMYEQSRTQPRSLMAVRKEAGREVKALLRELNNLFVDKLDAMMLLYKTTHREFYGQYMAKRTIINPGHRSTRVEGRVRDKVNNQELSRVKVSVKGTLIHSITSEDGTYTIKAPVLPSVLVVFEKEGYQTQTVEVPLRRGQATAQDIALELV